MKRLFCFGFGYSAMALARHLASQGWRASGTVRSSERAWEIEAVGFSPIPFSCDSRSAALDGEINAATHILISIPPGENGDPVLRLHDNLLRRAEALEWLGYLSTVGVYGDWGGAWVTEDNETRPVSERSRRRVGAERAWLDLAEKWTLPVHIFRLAGIYGPGRNALENLRNGTARRIDKPGQVFNRIHVDDIANILAASIARPKSGAIYNVSDDEPAPPQDVVAFAAQLLRLTPPPLIAFEKAELTPMGRSFYGENKRVCNDRIKKELAVDLIYPTYRQGLAAIMRSLRDDGSPESDY